MANDDFIKRDLRVLWHPCTQMRDHEEFPPIVIRRGDGVWLEDYDGGSGMPTRASTARSRRSSNNA